MRGGRAFALGAGGLMVLSVLLVGGAHPATQVALSAAVCLLSAAFALARGRRGVRLVSFSLPLLVAVAMTALQLVPLPAAVVRLLSPQVLEVRTDALSAMPAWLPLTYDVPATSLALARLLAMLGLLLIVGTTARPLQRAHRLLLAIAVLGGGLALIAFAHRALGATAILGVYSPHGVLGRNFVGTFVNGNHAASVFALAGLTAAGLAIELHDGRRQVAMVCAALCFAGVLLTVSRGGAVGLVAGAALLILWRLAQQLGAARAATLALVGVVAAGGVALWLSDDLRARFESSGGVTLVSNPKTRGWRDGVVLAGHHVLTGVGRGAFETAVEQVRDEDDHVRLVYAENAVVESLADWGMVATALILVLSAVSLRRLWRARRKLEAGTAGAACGVIAVLVHELADFGLEVPGVAFPTMVALAVVVARLDDRSDESEGPVRRAPPARAWIALAMWAAILPVSAWAARRTLDDDVEHVAELARSHDDARLAKVLPEAVARHPAADYFALVAAEQAARRKDPAAFVELNRALRLHPASWQAHRLTARLLAATGRRSQAAIEYRLAAQHGWQAPLDELVAVTGDHAVEGVVQTPEQLLALARYLAGRHASRLADAACVRAAELGGTPEAVQRERVSLALSEHNGALVHAAVAALLEQPVEAESYELAARALDGVGDPAAADRVLESGRKAHRSDGTLALATARIHLGRNDLAGARAALRASSDAVFTLPQRKAAEELLAQIADKSGDLDAAVAARARAKLLQARIERGQ